MQTLRIHWLLFLISNQKIFNVYQPHGLYDTSCGALVAMRNSSKESTRGPTTPRADTLSRRCVLLLYIAGLKICNGSKAA